MANIRICKKCGKIGLDQYNFELIYWKTQYYSDNCIDCKKNRHTKWFKNLFSSNGGIVPKGNIYPHTDTTSPSPEYYPLPKYYYDKRLRKFVEYTYSSSRASKESEASPVSVSSESSNSNSSSSGSSPSKIDSTSTSNSTTTSSGYIIGNPIMKEPYYPDNQNIIIGYKAGYNVTGSQNVCIGAYCNHGWPNTPEVIDE